MRCEGCTGLYMIKIISDLREEVPFKKWLGSICFTTKGVSQRDILKLNEHQGHRTYALDDVTDPLN